MNTAANSNRRRNVRAQGPAAASGAVNSRLHKMFQAEIRRHPTDAMRVPGATYRFQFTPEFTLHDATDLLDYLQALGVTDVYASPLFEAAPGSSHGYDVCGHGRISEDLGGEEAFRTFTCELQRRGMGLLLDIVPNHMAAVAGNAWWWNVLKHGASSRYANYFDIDWDRGGGKLVLPVLAEELEKVLAERQLTIAREDGEWVLKYFDRKFPLVPAPTTGHELPDGAATNDLLERQHYRLIHWCRGPREINYRRFFDVNELVSLRMERADVFAETHERVVAWLRDGTVQGVRVDHPDGLRDPEDYFARLRASVNGRAGVYVVAEKILSGTETLPRNWAIAGTTGYDFLNDANALFVASAHEGAMTDLYREFTGCVEDFDAVAYRSKKLILENSFAGDMSALAACLARATDEPLEMLRAAIVELVACFPTYRTYTQGTSAELSPSDAEVIRVALHAARNRSAHLASQFDVLEKVFSLGHKNSGNAELTEWILRFQQLTGPAAAKGIEDTAFYNYNRLVSLNEVGGDPKQFGISVAEFHRRNKERAKYWPHSLLATATHDTKRGEDTRARINVLSEITEDWRHAGLRWRKLNAIHKTELDGNPAPDANDEYLFYQTIVGAWDTQSAFAEGRERFSQFMLKAIREAKRHTSWTESNEHYERATMDFVRRTLSSAEFADDFMPFQRKVAYFGVFNSLAQTLIKLAAPGVPDTYQGSELWDFSLVDPDNRRPVNFELRRKLLQGGARTEESSKLFVITRALAFRREHREIFEHGNYHALSTDTEHLCAFAREFKGSHCIVIVPRLVCTLLRGEMRPPHGEEVWKDAVLNLDSLPCPGKAYRNLFTGERVRTVRGALTIGQTLSTFPVALMEPTDD